jgi:hypothetical protein
MVYNWWDFCIYVSLQGGYRQRMFTVYRFTGLPFTAYSKLILYAVFFCCIYNVSIPFSSRCIGGYRMWPSKWELISYKNFCCKVSEQKDGTPKKLVITGMGMGIVPQIWLCPLHHAPCMCFIIKPNPMIDHVCLMVFGSFQKTHILSVMGKTIYIYTYNGCRQFIRGWDSQQQQAWDLVLKCP